MSEKIVLPSSFSNPMTGQDDLIVGGAGGAPTRLGRGSSGQILTVDPATGHLLWATPAGGGGMTDPETTAGDMIYRNGSNVTSRLPVGSAGQVLGVGGGVPAWGYPALAYGGVGSTAATTACPSGSKTVVSFSSQYLGSGWWSAGSPQRVTPGVAGVYLVIARFYLTGINGQVYCRVSQNGATTFANALTADAYTNSTGNNITAATSGLVQLGATDYLGLYVEQYTGAGITLNQAFLELTRVA